MVTTKTSDKRELEKLLFFKGVEVESIQGLLEGCPVREIQASDVLIHAGQPNHLLYLLLSGQLRVHLKLTLDPIAILDAGEVVGELSVIDGQPTSAYVVAHTACQVLVMDEKTMWSLVDSCHAVARNLLFVLARRLRHGNSLILTGQQLEREYERFAVMDALTGIYNRRWFDRMLGRHVDRCQMGGESLAVFMIDVDHFKRYNESHGHVAGDRVLHTLARSLREETRPGEILARYGPDEFVLITTGRDASSAKAMGERICQMINEMQVFTLEGKPLPSVTASVGVAEMRTQDTTETLMEATDVALYHAKVKGGNQIYKIDR